MHQVQSARRCVDHDLGGAISRPSMGRHDENALRRCDHECKDPSRTPPRLSSLSRLMRLLRSVYIRIYTYVRQADTGCDGRPVPSLKRGPHGTLRTDFTVTWQANKEAKNISPTLSLSRKHSIVYEIFNNKYCAPQATLWSTRSFKLLPN